MADGLAGVVESLGTEWWAIGAGVALDQLARTGRWFSADDLVDLCGQPQDPHHLGAVFSAANRSGRIEAVGSKVGRRGRLVRLWAGVEANR